MRVRAAMSGVLFAAVIAGSIAGPLPQARASHSDAHRAQQRAEQLREQTRSAQGQLDAAKVNLADLSARANAALDQFQMASFAARTASANRAAAQARLDSAAAATHKQRQQLGAYAAQIYRSGGGTTMALLGSVLNTTDPQRVLAAAGQIQIIGDHQAQVLTNLRAAQQQEEQAKLEAQQRAAAATAAATEALAAKTRSDALTVEQRKVVVQLDARFVATQGAARAAASRAAALAHAEQVARQRAAAARAAGPTAACSGRDVSGYPNGQLPEDALCPLWGAPGQRLRADAAAAFNQMSRAFAAQFGAPICVTDSYRTYDEQVRLKQEKPGLAAEPGTSQHGWALATDLCGGIQNDGTSTNTWLRQNAGRFSWFHPSWADPGGSGPYEPWHWEYAGG